MIKAVVKNGMVVLCDPLPPDWQEGTEVEVEKSIPKIEPAHGTHPTDVWMDEVEAVASLGDATDDERLDAAIQAIRRREKERSRKFLGLDA